MSTKTVQCLVLLFALLQLGGSQGQQPIDMVLNESEGAEVCNKEDVRELREQVNQRLDQLERHLDNLTTLITTLTYGSLHTPALSCKQLHEHRPSVPSGRYWIHSTRHGYASYEYCDMTRECCGSRGGWMRVAHLDMTDPNQHCPPGFREITSPRRMCGRPGPAGCVSTTFPVHGVEYKKVCGKVIGYQYYSTDAFVPYYNNRQRTIDGVYVDGVSLTHGSSPRKHIWTFVAALQEDRSDLFVCPCTRPDLTYTGVVPPFIGQDYFCETGSDPHPYRTYYTGDPLWDGRGCGARSTCCSFNTPPWFCKELPHPTTDDIELRLCADEHISDEDFPIELVELYVQ